ncbi:MAG: hypothetical protein QOI73_379 [Solirubrobacteraceae bacterium]|nr:hypothetical protein [Solirubrobacteraceae bacterium]
MTLCCALAVATPAGASAASVAHRTGLAEAVVAIDRSNAVIAGFRHGHVVLARLDRAGRPYARRDLGATKIQHGDLRIAMSGDRVAVAWLEQQDAIVLARTGRRGGRVRRDRLTGRGVLFHELAVNSHGEVVDLFKDEAHFDDPGVSALVAQPGHAARRAQILAPTPRNPNLAGIGVDGAGGFHVSWVAEGPGRYELLGTADADPRGAFGPPAEQDLGSSLFGLDVATAADGSQLAAYERRSGRGEFLLVTARRPAVGRWQAPVTVKRLGDVDGAFGLAITPQGDGLLAYSRARVGGVLLAAAGEPRELQIGRGLLEGVVQARGRARILWSRFGRRSRLETATVDLASGRVTRPRVAVRDCYGEVGEDEDRPGRVAGDAAGEVVVVLSCGERPHAAVARLA